MNFLKFTAIAATACLLSACAFHRENVNANVVGMNDSKVPIVINGPVVQQPSVSSDLWFHNHVNFLTHNGLSIYDFYTNQSMNTLVKVNLDHTLNVMQLPIADLAHYKIRAEVLGLDVETTQIPATIYGSLVVRYKLFRDESNIWTRTVRSNAEMGYADSGNERAAVGDLMSFLLNNNTSKFAQDVASTCRFDMTGIRCMKNSQVW